MFVVDAQSGILPVEHDVADRLRRSRKPVVMAANKAESWKTEAQAAEFYELGLGELHTVSALQGIGTGDLLDAVVAKLPPPAEDEPDTTVSPARSAPSSARYPGPPAMRSTR